MKTGYCTGIILSQKAIFEKDKRIELYSPTHGKVTLLAKHAQSKSLKFGGKLDMTNIVTIHYFQGSSFKYITECDLIHNFKTIRTSYTHLLAVYYILDLIKKTSDIDQENEPLYTLLKTALFTLDTEKTLSFETFLSHFHQNYLKIEGLHHPNQSISHNEFKHIFQEYTGYSLMNVDNFIKG